MGVPLGLSSSHQNVQAEGQTCKGCHGHGCERQDMLKVVLPLPEKSRVMLQALIEKNERIYHRKESDHDEDYADDRGSIASFAHQHFPPGWPDSLATTASIFRALP